MSDDDKIDAFLKRLPDDYAFIATTVELPHIPLSQGRTPLEAYQTAVKNLSHTSLLDGKGQITITTKLYKLVPTLLDALKASDDLFREYAIANL